MYVKKKEENTASKQCKTNGCCRGSTFIDHQEYAGDQFDHFCVEDNSAGQVFLWSCQCCHPKTPPLTIHVDNGLVDEWIQISELLFSHPLNFT